MLAFKNIKAASIISAALLLLPAAFFFASATPLACAADPALRPTPPLQYETLTFPDAVPVAQLHISIPVLDAKGVPTTAPYRVTARGKIKLPTTGSIIITLMYDGLEHLQTLAQLNPARVIQFNAASLDLDDAQFAFFKRFTAIYRINLDSTMVTDKSVPILAMYKSLSELRISKVDITGAGFDALNGLPLAILNLEGSSLKEGNLQKIKSLPERLININLTKTHIGDSDIAFIAKCQKLTSVDLSGDKRLTDACVKDIVKLKMLDTLLIQDTSITEKSLPALAKMPNLKKLVIRNSSFWKLGTGKSPRPSLQILDAAVTSRTPVDVFYPLH